MEMRWFIIIVVLLTLFGCSITGRLERRHYGANVAHSPKESSKQITSKATQYLEVKCDSGSLFLAPASVDEQGEKMMSLSIDEVVVVSKSRTLPERKGKVSIDFVVTLPRELQGNCQSVVVTPYLYRNGKEVPLQELVIRGTLFSRVQDRNYWQYGRYRELFRPDIIGERRAFERFVKYPYPEGVRLDSVIESRNTISYYYTQSVIAEDNSKKFLITIGGRVMALDGSSYMLPRSDTLEYNICSMLSFIDNTPRYLTRVMSKYAKVNDRNNLSFRVNHTRIIDTLGNNRAQLGRIESLMSTLINQYTFHVDSIILTASSSPEGTFARNNTLAKERAYALRRYLVGKFGTQVDSLITVRWVAEDWGVLSELIGSNTNIVNRSQIQSIIGDIDNPDKRESAIKTTYPLDYKYIREVLYPKLRAVSFKYALRRVGMIQDTIRTTQPDTLYTCGIELLRSRRYSEALYILDSYKDLNSAIALMSLGYNQSAYDILCSLAQTAQSAYLSAILCSRLYRHDEGRAHFIRACTLNPMMEYRGSLDPEIAVLLRQTNN